MRLFPLLPYVALQDASGLTGIDIGTADFLVTHIHAFTLSTTVLVLVKGVVYSRSSRLVLVSVIHVMVLVEVVLVRLVLGIMCS